jgi:hypothetical protein
MNAGKYQRPRAGLGWQAKLPEELLPPSRGWESHKGWEQGWGNRPTSQSVAGGRSWSWSPGTEGSIQKSIAPLCWQGLGRGVTNQTELQQNGKAAATCWKQHLWPHCTRTGRLTPQTVHAFPVLQSYSLFLNISFFVGLLSLYVSLTSYIPVCWQWRGMCVCR